MRYASFQCLNSLLNGKNDGLDVVAGDQVHVQVGDGPVRREPRQQEILPGLQIQEVCSRRDEAGSRPLR